MLIPAILTIRKRDYAALRKSIIEYHVFGAIRETLYLFFSSFKLRRGHKSVKRSNVILIKEMKSVIGVLL